MLDVNSATVIHFSLYNSPHHISCPEGVSKTSKGRTPGVIKNASRADSAGIYAGCSLVQVLYQAHDLCRSVIVSAHASLQ